MTTLDSSPTPLIPKNITTTPIPIWQPNSYPQERLQEQGVIILSMSDGKHIHLFAYNPQFLPLTRLMDSVADDITPAISPDGTTVAFSSCRNGYWDLFILDLTNGNLTRLTDSAEYDGAPSWSPDGQWLAYESYIEGNLEILIQSVADLTQPPIRLTYNPGIDHSPSWASKGRRIAFVSDRSGIGEIWLAFLDKTDDRFINVSHYLEGLKSHPAWSPDGNKLAWSSESEGVRNLFVWDSLKPDSPANYVCPGNWPVWSPEGKYILTEIRNPNHTSLVIYDVATSTILFPSNQLPGSIYGLTWKSDHLPELLNNIQLPKDADKPAQPLWESTLTVFPLPPSGRFSIAHLEDVTVPFPYLYDAIDESFHGLRHYVANTTGWDFLSSLENAFLPITEPPTLDREQNWLYTGRAITVNPVPLQAGWMVIIKEEYSGRTYWRVYLKTRYQDGSQGRPLTEQPWDINARYAGDPLTYEQGGKFSPISAGYWVDFTELAARYDWERLPALINWRTFFPAARFNQFLISSGKDWNTAMAEILPPEAIITATCQPTHTTTATEIPITFGLYSPTPTNPSTNTPTRRPTWTPIPETGSP